MDMKFPRALYFPAQISSSNAHSRGRRFSALIASKDAMWKNTRGRLAPKAGILQSLIFPPEAGRPGAGKVHAIEKTRPFQNVEALPQIRELCRCVSSPVMIVKSVDLMRRLWHIMAVLVMRGRWCSYGDDQIEIAKGN